jgi:hypothetical protein
MSYRFESRARLAAAAALVFTVGCGHPPLAAYATPQPIMLGPVQHLPGGSAAAQDASDLRTGRFSAIASATISATAQATGNGGTYTTTTQAQSLGSVLDAAAADAIQGDARGRLAAKEVACSSVVFYALFYLFSEEQCTLSGRAERPRPVPKAAPAGAPLPETASRVPADAALE